MLFIQLKNNKLHKTSRFARALHGPYIEKSIFGAGWISKKKRKSKYSATKNGDIKNNELIKLKIENNKIK